jgi:hypothetical protein
MNNQNNGAAISDIDLDKVSGGFACFFGGLVARAVSSTTGGKTTGGSESGGQNDPAQMFQQILQQLTHQ